MKICIFCSGRNTIAEKYKKEAYELSKQLALQGHSLIYGGGYDGLMGECYKGFHDHNGYCVAVIPEVLLGIRRIVESCDEAIITKNMQERKAKMIELGDVFLVLPGGPGTYDELYEVIVGKQIGTHNKSIIVYNIDGYYDGLVDCLSGMYKQGFMSQTPQQIINIVNSTSEVLEVINE